VKPARIPYGTEPFLIDDLVEKPAPEKAPSDYAITARYIFSPEIFLYLHRTPPGADGEIQLTDAIRAMVRVGRQVWAVPLVAGEVRYDVGNFLDYAKAFIDIALADPQVGHALREHLLQMLVDGPAKEALSATSDEETGWL
jgi:UTP--glucose-1-phosphate uridylyltransferase